LGGGWRRRPGIGGTDGRAIEMPALYHSHEATLALQSEQVWVENLSLTTERPRSSARSIFRGCVRHAIAAFAQFVPHCLLSRCARNAARRSGVSFMIGGMILLVVATGVFASTVTGMLNDGRRLP
jgi:hypothetical protein